jgi:hypothetical protein
MPGLVLDGELLDNNIRYVLTRKAPKVFWRML